MAETIKIAGELESVATGGKVVDISNVKDRTKGNKSQSLINADIEAAIQAETERATAAENNRYLKSETYNKTELNSMITTPNQEYVTVAATDQTTAATDVLPATGSADKVYRVGNWDGTQFDVTVYSEYSWNGSAYVHLSTKAQIGEVFDISAYHATGGTLATYDDLNDALNGTNGGVPQELRRGGMSVKYVQTSDNKYVQYRLMKNQWSIDTEDWAIVDEGVYIENPEFIDVKIDKYKRIIWAVNRKDGTIHFGAGVPPQIIDYITKKINELSLDEYNDIVDFLGQLIDGDKTLKQLLDEKLDAEGLDKEALETQSIIENPEFIDVKLDNKKSIVSGRDMQGVLHEFVGIETPNIKVGETDFNSFEKNVDKINNQAIFAKEYLRTGTNKLFDISGLGLFFYVHVSNFSENAVTLPLNFYNASETYQGIASVYWRGTSDYYNENVKYGRAYLKAGEDVTILISNENSYKYLGVVTSGIPDGVQISFELCTRSYGQFLEKTAVTMPFLGNGKLYIQPMNYNYAHCARIANIGKYLIVCFSGNQRNTSADATFPQYGQYQTMCVIEKGNYNNIVYKLFGGSPNDGEYNYTNGNVRICPKDNDVHLMYSVYNSDESPAYFIHRKFDTLKFEFTPEEKMYLHYNDTTVEWSKYNELVMLNTLYDANLEVGDFAIWQISDIRYYNGYFYTLLGGNYPNFSAYQSTDKYPWTLLKSTDCITWEPVACINPNNTFGELVFDICDDVILIQIRSNNNFGHSEYNGYMVCDINGNVLKQPTYLSNVDSKGSVFVKDNNLYIVYNVESEDNTHYYKRNKIAIAKLNDDYSLSILKTYTDMNGFQYFDFNCKDNVVFMANTEDPRGYNYQTGYGPYGGGLTIAIVNDEIFQNNN